MKRKLFHFQILSFILYILPIAGCTDNENGLPHPVVEAEEEVYTFVPAENGAGPMWCFGSTSIVRVGKTVYASGIETVPEWKPLNNCRWMLFERSDKGWIKRITDNEGRTREPAPMSAFHDGRYFLSANPTITDTSRYDGPSRPEMISFDNRKESKGEKLFPLWEGSPDFTEHSYRSFAADGKEGELILFQNIGYTHAEWSFLDKEGKWSAQGKLEWPWGSDNEVPGPIRVCYPNVMLKDRAVYFCGVSDIIEPKKEWREFKRQLTGKEWDYDFRRLFFTWTDDITKGKFNNWVEIASREETCGWVSPADLWVAHDGSVHILWIERAIDERLREKFFPNARQSYSLNYAIVRNGKVDYRTSLLLSEEGKSNEIPLQARFHVTPAQRLMVVYAVRSLRAEDQQFVENRILEISPDGKPGDHVVLPLKNPFSNFFTATVRAGSKPSKYLDMYGTPDGVKNAMHYARILIK